jgi:outer membrane protein insertion porin family
MNVVNRLARAGIHVENGAIALLMDVGLHRQFLGNLKHLSDKSVIFRREIVQCWDVLSGSDQEMHGRLGSKVFKCHYEVVLMHKFRRGVVSDDPAKKARLLHRCNLALLGVLLCTTLLVITRTTAEAAQDSVKRTEVLSYEGQKVSSVELAGQPEVNLDDLMPLVTQRGGDDFSAEKIDATIAALQGTGRFKDVQLDLRPEQDGVRVVFILQPAIYFGMYQFSGAEEFPYVRLLQIANYVQQEPYSAIDIQNAQESLVRFLQRNGYFQAEVNPDVEVDKANGLANVNFQVTLNKRAKFGNIIIQGPTPEESERLQRSLRGLRARMKSSAIREGKDYSLSTLQNATRFLESRLQGENRLAAGVKLIGAEYDVETNRADITFDIQLGPIVHARIEGAHVWPWTRHRLLPVYQQNGLTPELIQEGRQNLLDRYRQKGFFDVEVETETSAQPTGIMILYRVKKGERKKITDVAFRGNTGFEEDELRQHVNVEEAGFLSKGSYNDSSIKTLQAFYQSKGFNEVRVTPDFSTTEGDVVVTFVVDEGPRDIVESLVVQGNNSVPVSELAPDGLELSAGQPYAQKSIDNDRTRIMTHYLESGYLTATFHSKSEPTPTDPHRFNVTYEITEGPQVRTGNIVTIGKKITKDRFIQRQTQELHTGEPITEREILSSESNLYTAGVFDWAEVNPRRQITSQDQEDVIVKVHESKLNTITYGFGFEAVSKGGRLPTGTVAVPGLPPVGLPDEFETSQRTVKGPRANIQYTRNNLRGKAETLTIGGLYGPLNRNASILFTDPHFRWTSWTASLTGTAEHNKENPIFNKRQAQFGLQFQKPLDAKKTQNLFLRYTLTQTGLSDLVIPALVPPEDLHTRLSTLAAVWTRDTRDNSLDAHSGLYNSFEVNVNPAFLGSNNNFGKLLVQAATYKTMNGIVWANSARIGFLAASGGDHVPLSQKFFSGGGSTLRGFPLNGAGPQSAVLACDVPLAATTCAQIRVPTGGRQLLILNTEFRFPVPFKKGLSFVTFYDGGNVYDHIGFNNLGKEYTNTVGIGVRYATPVGPVRFDIGHNLNPVAGIKATQFFITLGQAF